MNFHWPKWPWPNSEASALVMFKTFPVKILLSSFFFLSSFSHFLLSIILHVVCGIYGLWHLSRSLPFRNSEAFTQVPTSSKRLLVSRIIFHIKNRRFYFHGFGYSLRCFLFDPFFSPITGVIVLSLNSFMVVHLRQWPLFLWPISYCSVIDESVQGRMWDSY